MFAKKPFLLTLLGVLTLVGVLLLFKCLAGEDTPSGFPRKHPEEVQEHYDGMPGVFRSLHLDGSDEIICRNGVRRPLYLKRLIVHGPRVPDDLKVAPYVRNLPEWVFPVMTTRSGEADAVPLIYRLDTGEILWRPETTAAGPSTTKNDIRPTR